MVLKIDTFSNAGGIGNAFYKAITHPLAAPKARALIAALKANQPVAVYDPLGMMEGFDEFYPLNEVTLAGYFIQNVDHLDLEFHGSKARPITELRSCAPRCILIASFDSERARSQIAHLIQKGAAVFSFDDLRLEPAMQSDSKRYLSNLNFATNFAFFRDGGGLHTRISTVNYWGQYGAKGGYLWLSLFDQTGAELAVWREDLPGPGAAISIDSAQIRERFGLSEFTGQLFMHTVGAAGHDIVKYALDIYSDGEEGLSCTHDANSWPSDLYAGLPAPKKGEDVILWVQNSHPRTIPSGEIGLNVMGKTGVVTLDRPVAPFATYALRLSELLPDVQWPQQIEIRAAKNFVRPRYEIVSDGGHRRMAHPNVERTDLKPDPRLAELGNLFGKLYILPAPILPVDRYSSFVLPTPMATNQKHLPLKALLYNTDGRQVGEHSFGNLARSDSVALDLGRVLNGHASLDNYGHAELVYDFAAGREADGWLHALFRYEDRQSGHAAETSFGAHIFNTVLTYKNEPQSYAGPAPGLTTRLFLRIGPEGHETFCHLIYPASQPWHEYSSTTLMLMSRDGTEIVQRDVRIACGGSLLWRVGETFDHSDILRAGSGGYVVVRDKTCRLFGYHGLMRGQGFSLDHMFGF